MTINAQTGISDVMLGDGVNLVFPFDFMIGGTDEVRVYGDGVLIDASGYSVDRSADWSGDVTFDTAPADGVEIVIVSDPDFVQSTVHQRQGPFYPDVVEDDLDRAVLRDIYLKREIGRSLKAPLGEVMGDLPSALERSNKIFGFDINGNPTIVTGVRPDDGVIDDGVWLSSDAFADDGLWTAPFTDIIDDGVFL